MIIKRDSDPNLALPFTIGGTAFNRVYYEWGRLYLKCDVLWQCFSMNDWCNNKPDCKNLNDEKRCTNDLQSVYRMSPDMFLTSIFFNRPPSVVDFFVSGALPTVRPIRPPFSEEERTKVPYNTLYDNTIAQCPQSHFTCPRGGHCLPVYVRCNGVYDCPGREDEEGCEVYTCPQFYRCRDSRLCLHPIQVCDGNFHCPQHDDELLCDLVCPRNCSCQGLAFTCPSVFSVDNYTDLRYLNASSSGLTPESLSNNPMLVYLSLGHCGLTDLRFPALPNLNFLDVRHNAIQAVPMEHLKNVSNLRVLSLIGNPVMYLFTGSSASDFSKLQIMDMSMVKVPDFNADTLRPFSSLTHLNMSGSAVQRVFGRLTNPELRVLDIRGCKMQYFSKHLLKNLSKLSTLHADNYKLCCHQTLPEGFNAKNCHVHSAATLSCDSLLGSNTQRIMVSVVALLALTGNMANLIIRNCIPSWRETERSINTYLYISHLCLSNFFTGVHLAVLGVMDKVYSGSYLWKDRAWRSSPWCVVSGFLFLLSSQVSVFVIVCMTLERCIVIGWPDRAYRDKKVTRLLNVLSWASGIVLAAIIVVFQVDDLRQTSLCIPLPHTGDAAAGYGITFGIVVVLNSVLMLLAAAGQTYIYLTVRRSTMTFLVDSQRARDLTVACRVINIVVTDACCWFIIALLAVLSSQFGTAVPGSTRFILAHCVTFVNSATNPYLYFINVASEQRRNLQRQRLLQRLGHTVIEN